MIVKVIGPNEWNKYPVNRKKIQTSKQAIEFIISTKCCFRQPGRIEWVIDPLRDELLFALVEDARGITTIEVVA